MLDINTLAFWFLPTLVCQNLNLPPAWLKSSNGEDKVRIFYAVKCKNFIVI